jgi:hypothetical protein
MSKTKPKVKIGDTVRLPKDKSLPSKYGYVVGVNPPGAKKKGVKTVAVEFYDEYLCLRTNTFDAKSLRPVSEFFDYKGFELFRTTPKQVLRIFAKLAKTGVVFYSHDDGIGLSVRSCLEMSAKSIGLLVVMEPHRVMVATPEAYKQLLVSSD